MAVKRAAVACLASIAASLVLGTASADEAYPAKPVRIIAPVAISGAVDVMTRILAQRLGEAMGQQFIVENRVGAAGTVGASFASKAAPDGYTLLMTTNAPLTTNLALYKKLDYSWHDFEPIMVVAQAPVVLIVTPSSGLKSVPDMVALSKRTNGGLSTATTGNGSIGHFVLSDLMRKAGANLVHVAYKGGVAGVTAVATGETPVGILDQGAASPFIKDGRVRALGIVGEKRSSVLPEVPTLAELGISGSDIIAWVGFLAPKGTPKPIIQKLNTETAKALKDPTIRQKLITVGAEPVDGSTPENFAVYLRHEVARWEQRVKDANLKIE